MQFCFIANGDVLTLPITPASYEWTTGKNIETINISQLGDVYLPGNRSRHSGTIECLLPSQDYPFNQPGTILTPAIIWSRCATGRLKRSPCGTS